jgi:hypothetical protein
VNTPNEVKIHSLILGKFYLIWCQAGAYVCSPKLKPNPEIQGKHKKMTLTEPTITRQGLLCIHFPYYSKSWIHTYLLSLKRNLTERIRIKVIRFIVIYMRIVVSLTVALMCIRVFFIPSNIQHILLSTNWTREQVVVASCIQHFLFMWVRLLLETERVGF